MFTLLILAVYLVVPAYSDTPANCTYEDIVGKWVFEEGSRGYDRTIDCSKKPTIVSSLNLELFFPNLAVDENGNEGFWTLIYNQGFEVTIAGRKYFAFSKYKTDGKNVTSICTETLPGWSHNSDDNDWACYVGEKTQIQRRPVMKQAPLVQSPFGYYKTNMDFISEINKAQSSWKAAVYPEYEGLPLAALINRLGGIRSHQFSPPKPAPITRSQQLKVLQLPETFDWRNMGGVNYVSPIRNQEQCGSCYAFASMAMGESRVRIMSNNSRQPVFSPQDIVECSEYSQGCAGGFPYLIAGKYAEDFGLVEESCNPYKGKDGKCSTIQGCKRNYFTKYEYLGGFYGACNEALMKINLVENGPLAVGFEVLSDFMHYKSGVYKHTGLMNKFFPFELTNHAVLVVGYGTDKSTREPYWVVKNSWGPKWGEDGYFRILRGYDEVAIESMAVQSLPIL